jgi:SAM-dependent methyltransferase
MTTWVRRAMFEAPWWAMPLNPHFLPRRALWRAMQRSGGALRGRVLDVGCGVQPYRRLMIAADSVVGLEIDTEKNRLEKNADAFYDGMTLPFDDGSFDGVLCNQVLEHVFAPDRFVGEIRRVLAADGVLVLSVPFVWPEHEQPWDSQRYSSFGLKDLLNRNGFEVAEHAKLVPGCAALFALAASGVNGAARRWPLPIRLLLRFAGAFPLTVLGAITGALASRDPELYLDNFVVARAARSSPGSA